MPYLGITPARLLSHPSANALQATTGTFTGNVSTTGDFYPLVKNILRLFLLPLKQASLITLLSLWTLEGKALLYKIRNLTLTHQMMLTSLPVVMACI